MLQGLRAWCSLGSIPIYFASPAPLEMARLPVTWQQNWRIHSYSFEAQLMLFGKYSRQCCKRVMFFFLIQLLSHTRNRAISYFSPSSIFPQFPQNKDQATKFLSSVQVHLSQWRRDGGAGGGRPPRVTCREGVTRCLPSPPPSMHASIAASHFELKHLRFSAPTLRSLICRRMRWQNPRKQKT